MTLNDCTKEDLKWLIHRILFHTDPFGQDYQLQRALNDLVYEKEKQKLDEAEKHNKIATDKTREYQRLLKPYIGKPSNTIPMSVLKQAAKLETEIDAANRTWAKLVGIKLDG